MGEDWLNKFGYLPIITGIVFINDWDSDTGAVVYFDEIIDIADGLPIAPRVKTWDSIGEISVSNQGVKSMTVHFYSRVIDPDSYGRKHSVIPVYIDDYIPVRAKGELGTHILDYLARRSKDLKTYLIVGRDSVVAKIVLATSTLTPTVNSYDEELPLTEENRYWLSKPIKLFRNGRIVKVLAIMPESDWQFRLGRDLTWFWCGNFENEGSSLWSINQADEFYHTVAYQSQRSLCQRRQIGTNPLSPTLKNGLSVIRILPFTRFMVVSKP